MGKVHTHTYTDTHTDTYTHRETHTYIVLVYVRIRLYTDVMVPHPSYGHNWTRLRTKANMLKLTA